MAYIRKVKYAIQHKGKLGADGEYVTDCGVRWGELRKPEVSETRFGDSLLCHSCWPGLKHLTLDVLDEAFYELRLEPMHRMLAELVLETIGLLMTKEQCAEMIEALDAETVTGVRWTVKQEVSG
jgi:hypothetical protein